jgi:hypothetical protein
MAAKNSRVFEKGLEHGVYLLKRGHYHADLNYVVKL